MEEINCRLIIGLGNPGKKYEKTYHNAGFLGADFLAKNFPNFIFLKSDVFMNQSGSFVKKTLKKYETKPEELLIIHDDFDIELGKYKISFGRGSAGHNGIESVIQSLKTKNFWRLRIGIGKKTDLSAEIKKEKAGLPAIAQRAKAGKFVLRKISPADMKVFNILLPSLVHDRVLSLLFSPAVQLPRPR